MSALAKFLKKSGKNISNFYDEGAIGKEMLANRKAHMSEGGSDPITRMFGPDAMPVSDAALKDIIRGKASEKARGRKLATGASAGLLAMLGYDGLK